MLFRKRLQLRFKFLFILKGFKNSKEQIVGGLAQEVLHFFLHSTKEPPIKEEQALACYFS